jgi:hypothetical protein
MLSTAGNSTAFTLMWKPVLRIWDDYPGPDPDFLPSWIQQEQKRGGGEFLLCPTFL